jgi:hypothetical protein
MGQDFEDCVSEKRRVDWVDLATLAADDADILSVPTALVEGEPIDTTSAALVRAVGAAG